MSAAPRVSLVINTLDRAHLLGDALGAVRALDYPSLEVIVVNGPSRDDTERVLGRWEGALKVGSCPIANLSVSRNIGIGLAEGEVIAFLDDDAAPHPGWLAALANAFGDPRVGGAGGFTIDNTGVRWQVRKTICDRFGNAYDVAPHFDERPLCRPGSPYYPSLLGANSAFRAQALREIGGFDETFAYFLDETDVCLRLIDAGWRVVYEPEAIVFHQFAPSALRAADRVARTLYPSAVSKSYFIMRHGAAASPSDAAAELGRFKKETLGANDWLCRHGDIDEAHRFSLDQDVAHGIEEGVRRAGAQASPSPPLRRPKRGGFLALPRRTDALKLAFVTQGFEPAEAGIARWTSLAARSLAERGHQVHVLTRTRGEEFVEFRDGLWVHRMAPLAKAAPPVAELYDIPAHQAAWCARVWREAQMLKSFGAEVVSAPIWDLEGVAVADDPDFASVVSLHTTYAMAKPFKPEWALRPLFEREVVAKIVGAEKRLLAHAPLLLANSQAVVAEIESLYGLDISQRAVVVPHGTTDPLVRLGARAGERERRLAEGAPLRVLYVGRFEPRKGFDIALQAAARLAAAGGIEVWFAGDTPEGRGALFAEVGAEGLELHPAVRWLGLVSREALDEAYADCDVVLAPSRFESFGLVAIEAMAAGRPVVGLACGGTAEVVQDGVSGRLFAETPSVADEIAAELLRMDRDRERLGGLGRGARAAYERHYSVAAMADGLEAAYRRAAAMRRTRARAA